jgi:hypothetical protein
VSQGATFTIKVEAEKQAQAALRSQQVGGAYRDLVQNDPRYASLGTRGRADSALRALEENKAYNALIASDPKYAALRQGSGAGKAAAQIGGQLASSVGSAAGIEGIGGVISSVAALAAAAGPAAAIVAAFAMAGAAVYAFTKTVNSFVERGQELAKYSAPLSAAGARSEIRDIMADIREANALGDDIARLTDAQSELWTDVRDLLLPIKRAIVEELADALEGIRNFVETAGPLLGEMAHHTAGLVHILAAWAKGDYVAMWEALAEDYRDTRRAAKADKDMLLDDFAAMLDAGVTGQSSLDPMRRRLAQKMNAPALPARVPGA